MVSSGDLMYSRLEFNMLPTSYVAQYYDTKRALTKRTVGFWLLNDSVKRLNESPLVVQTLFLKGIECFFLIRKQLCKDCCEHQRCYATPMVSCHGETFLLMLKVYFSLHKVHTIVELTTLMVMLLTTKPILSLRRSPCEKKKGNSLAISKIFTL